jgi:hypothetical protein
MRLIVVAGLSLLFHANAQPPSSDPIFGMVFDAGKVHFEMAPSLIGESCKGEKGRKYWLFAHAKTADAEYFVVSNRRSEDSGASMVIRGKQCEIGPGEAILGYEGPTPKEVVQQLALDAFQRYSKAFGSKKAFLEAEKKGGLAPKELGPVLGPELEKFAAVP